MDAGISLEIFDLLADCAVFKRSRHEVGSRAFSKLRRAVRELILLLRTDEAGNDWSEDQLLRLQRQLANWLTSPSSFSGQSADELRECLGDVRRRFANGDIEVIGHIESALEAVGILATAATPLQQEVSRVIRALAEQGRDFRIYCHRTLRPSFLECICPSEQSLLADERFLYTPSEYRDSQPFGVLIKIGPLRSEGWGATPSAVLSAPRFRELVQIVWSSTADDPHFGLDPLLGTTEQSSNSGPSDDGKEFPGGIRWHLQVHACGEEGDGHQEDAVDDLALLSIAGMEAEPHRLAVLVALAGSQGVLYPPSAEVLVFDPAAVGERCAGQLRGVGDLGRGNFLVWPHVQEGGANDQIGFGGQRHAIWRARLAAELAKDAAGFARRLTATGLALAYPEQAARHWVRPPTTVIHAPKTKRHFAILMKVLGIPSTENGRKPWAEGWREVRQSRGEAIQAGVQEHARLMESCIAVLVAGRGKIAEEDLRGGDYEMPLAGEAGLFGVLHFMRIEGVEDGYRAPESELRQIQGLDEVVRWRV